MVEQILKDYDLAYGLKSMRLRYFNAAGADAGGQLGERRRGDSARLVADASKARAELAWKPQYADLDTIVAHAWQWERRHANSD